MFYGNARNYLASSEAPKPPSVTCLKLFLDVAEGLVYLHSGGVRKPVIHGGLKSSNILIDGEGTAKITDFALASMAEFSNVSLPRSERWSAPEILEGDDCATASDIYSFSCLMLEILTDEEPYAKQRHQLRLQKFVRQGGRPAFPESETARLRGLESSECPMWKLMNDCWALRQEDRPTAVKVRDTLRGWVTDQVYAGKSLP